MLRQEFMRVHFWKGDLTTEQFENFRHELKRRSILLSASMVDAEFLAISDSFNGARSDHGDLSGAIQSLPGRSRLKEAKRFKSLGIS